MVLAHFESGWHVDFLGTALGLQVTGCSFGAGGKPGETLDDEEVLVSILKRGGAASRLSDGGGGAAGSIENKVVGGFFAAVRGVLCIEVSVRESRLYLTQQEMRKRTVEERRKA